MHFFFHIPKTAGTSFKGVLKNIFRSVNDEDLDDATALALQYRIAEERDITYRRSGSPARERAQALLRRMKLLRQKRKRTVVVGHFGARLVDGKGALLSRYPWVVGNPEVEVVTLLRDPLEHALSTYYHRARQGKLKTDRLALGKFLESHHVFAYRRIFGERRDALALLKSFSFMGVAEDMQRSTDLFTDRLGVARRPTPVENIGPRDAQCLALGAQERSRFEQFYDWEYTLYHAVRDQLTNPSIARSTSDDRFRDIITVPTTPVDQRQFAVGAK